jgi:Mrp family chromosome partitioning ATPase
MAAAAYQAYGRTAILIELDFDAPSLARRLQINSSPGVAEILRDGAPIEECLHMPDDGSPGVLVAGNADGDSARLLSNLRSSNLVRDVGGLCDVVIADLPPLSPSGQAASLAPLFPTVLLVVRSGTAPVSEIRRAVDDLDKSPPVILNGFASSIPRPLRSFLAG